MHLIIGASGTAGSRVSRRLLERGERVRAVSRTPSKLAEFERLGAEVVRGDLREGEWMNAALQGVRYLVLTSQGFFPPSRSNNPERADEEGNRRIIDAAKRAGIEHVVFVSVSMAGPDSPVLFGRLKYRVEQYLQASGLPHTIVRPTTFIETHALRLLGEPLRNRGKVSLLGGGTTPTNWISAEDLADYIVRARDEPALRNATVTVGGPDVLDRVEVLEILERALGKKAKRSNVPVAALRAVRFLAGPFHPGIRYLLDFAITDATMRDSPEWSSPRLDWTAPTTVKDAVEGWIGNGGSPTGQASASAEGTVP